MKRIKLLIILLMCSAAMFAQTTKVTGPKKKAQTTNVKSQPKVQTTKKKSDASRNNCNQERRAQLAREKAEQEKIQREYLTLRWNESTKSLTYKDYSYKMVYVAGGSFDIGEKYPGYHIDNISHRVTLDSYYIGQTEVPQWLWIAVMGSCPSNWTGDMLPVEQVSWNDCQSFIEKLNSKTKASFKFPTEAQWEFAARGGNNSRGYKYSGSDNFNDVAFYDRTYQTYNVGSKKNNELGIYDLTGNVLEWCNDYYKDFDNIEMYNPQGPDSGTHKVFRGGNAWGGGNSLTERRHLPPTSKMLNVGFRLGM